MNPPCHHCLGSGIIYEDEYENGVCVGRGTVARKCVCQIKEPEDFSGGEE